ncbi:MAG: hypothetical protein D6794_08840 [Deltaproteobacteria bacterium]|nr:MAG: hypothetical protein D6794_08840 [Deltaproteobacteria bacterium]
MSYILDSLKKAEQQRRKKEGVEIRVAVEPGGEGRSRRRARPGILVLAGLLVLVSVGGVLLANWDFGLLPAAKVEDSGMVAKTVRTPYARPSGGVRDATLKPDETAGAQERPGAGKTVAPSVTGTTPPASAPPDRRAQPSGVLTLDQLPAGLRARAAGLHVSLHYFAPKAAQRLVRLDGRILHEGEGLPDGPRVVRIDRSGVVLDWNGYRFHLAKP